MANPFQGDDEDPFSGARDEEGGIKKQTFGQAFAAARKAGDKTFMFNGKKYSTRTKEEPSEATIARIDRKAKEELKGPSEADIDRMVKKFDRPSFADLKGKTMKEKMAAMRGGMKKGGMVSASKRADGCAIKGKTRGKMV